MKRIAVLPIALLLAVAVLLAGCGSGSTEPESAPAPPPAPEPADRPAPSPPPEAADPPAQNESAVVQAAARTSESGSARMAMTVSMTMPGIPVPVDFGAEGEFDFAAQQGRMTVDYSGLLEAMGPQGEQARGFLPDRMLIDGPIVYMRMPALERFQPGKSWLRMDVEAAAEAQGLSGSLLGPTAAQTDPSQALDYLLGASESVEEVGKEKIRGVPTRRFRAVIDFTRAPDMLTPDQQAAYEQAIAQLGGAGLTKVPVEVWVDGDELLRRMAMEMTFAAPDGSGEISMAYGLDLFDFGVDVDVAPPPAEKVVDMSELGFPAG